MSNPKEKFVSRMEEAYKAKIKEYAKPTLIGFWIDRDENERAKLALFKKKRGRCQTLTLRKNIIFENLLKPIQLQQAKPYISYGDALQITTHEVQCKEYGIKPHVITSIITERDIDVTLNLCHGCPVVATMNTKPCLRNVLTLVDPKEGRSQKDVTYGKDVYICLYDSGTDRTLYLQAMVADCDTFGGESEHYPLRLNECPDRYSKFKILHWDPNERDVCVGDEVPSNEKIVIAHMPSNRFLVTEKTCVPSLFGSELAVSCYVYQNMGRQLACNFWQLTIQAKKTLKQK